MTPSGEKLKVACLAELHNSFVCGGAASRLHFRFRMFLSNVFLGRADYNNHNKYMLFYIHMHMRSEWLAVAIFYNLFFKPS
jgi:uncharacterized protein (DUF1919 family)